MNPGGFRVWAAVDARGSKKLHEGKTGDKGAASHADCEKNEAFGN